MRTTLLATGAAAVLLALAGCSGQSDSDDAGTAAPAEKPAAAARDEAGSDGDAAVNVLLESPDRIKTGMVTIVSKDLDDVRTKIETLLAQHGGSVDNESTVNDDKGRPTTSSLTIRVPSAYFYAVMRALEADPSTTSSDIKSENAHQQVVDVAARLAQLRVSHKRLLEFLAGATTTADLLDYEQRITNVESQIAQLTSQRDALAQQISMSTITLQMRTPEAPAPKEKDPLEHAGFLTGLSNGWSALMDVLLVAATVAGAVLPFGVLAVLLAAPVLLLLRRRSASRGLVDEVGEAG